MPRPLDTTLSRCPEHATGRVTKRGTYGTQQRTMYRCAPRGGTTHYFTITPPGYLRGFRYPTSEIAHALWMLGRGTSFWQAGADARDRMGRPESNDTNLSAFWLERFSERIFEALRPRANTLHSVIVDSVPFNVAAVDYKGLPIAGGEMRYIVFGAANQKRVGGPYSVLLLRAYRHKDARSYRSFFAQIDGKADRIVCDGEQALLQSAKARWPRAKVALSVYQVRKRAEDILTEHGLQSRTKPLWKALQVSTRTAAAWRRFVTLAREHRLADLEEWIIRTEAELGPQFARHERFTSTGVIEAVLRAVKTDLARQGGNYRQTERLSLLLNLHTLARNGVDREAEYARVIERGS
jgi:hypothetical protein